METIEQNKQTVRRAVEEIWNGAKYENLDEFILSDFVVHTPSPDLKIYGLEGTRQFFTELRNAFPDLYFTITDQVAEGDKVVTYYVAEGTHKGPFKGIAPTGKRIRITAIDIDRLANGKVAECWSNMDELGLLQQLGAVPERAHT
jgi:predicted ester cyclase